MAVHSDGGIVGEMQVKSKSEKNKELLQKKKDLILVMKISLEILNSSACTCFGSLFALHIFYLPCQEKSLQISQASLSLKVLNSCLSGSEMCGRCGLLSVEIFYHFLFDTVQLTYRGRAVKR